MSNMSYCRFQNTAPDLQDCYDALDEDWNTFSFEELRACASLIGICIDFAQNFGDELPLMREEIARRQAERGQS